VESVRDIMSSLLFVDVLKSTESIQFYPKARVFSANTRRERAKVLLGVFWAPVYKRVPGGYTTGTRAGKACVRDIMSSLLFVDMLFMRWTESGLRGQMLLRGANNKLLAKFNPLPAAHNINGHTYYCMELPLLLGGDARATNVMGRKISHAQSVRIDARKHPVIRVVYTERLSAQETEVSCINVEHNYILFEKGVFADARLQEGKCGALLVCGNCRGDALLPLSEHPIRLVDWRQCKVLVQRFLHTLAYPHPAPRHSDTLQKQNEHAVSGVSPEHQWDRVFNKCVCDHTRLVFAPPAR